MVIRKPHGEVVEYKYSTKIIINYYGLYHGVYEIWHENGQLSKRCTYLDDKLNGLYEE